MAKYRGRTPDGKTRGNYVRKVLMFSSEKEEKVRKVEEDIVRLLSNSGYCVSDASVHQEGYNIGHNIFGGSFRRERAYHVGGASIGVEGMYYKKPFKSQDGTHQYSVKLNFVTNDSLDDILQKITQKIPTHEFYEI